MPKYSVDCLLGEKHLQQQYMSRNVSSNDEQAPGFEPSCFKSDSGVVSVMKYLDGYYRLVYVFYLVLLNLGWE